ncbi:EF-hand domain-containing protein D2 isoform X2 [Macaca nemestrina]|uniref:EF-hand domain-containing protein D2 isoform X2 n=1 Tax=Macaca nemestrina TaxID=9545 RepID=UPI0039B92E3D
MTSRRGDSGEGGGAAPLLAPLPPGKPRSSPKPRGRSPLPSRPAPAPSRTPPAQLLQRAPRGQWLSVALPSLAGGRRRRAGRAEYTRPPAAGSDHAHAARVRARGRGRRRGARSPPGPKSHLRGRCLARGVSGRGRARPAALRCEQGPGQGECRAGHHGHGRAGHQAEPAAADGGRGRRRDPGATRAERGGGGGGGGARRGGRGAGQRGLRAERQAAAARRPQPGHRRAPVAQPPRLQPLHRVQGVLQEADQGHGEDVQAGWLWNPPVREANRMALESLGGADNSLGGALEGFVSRDLPERYDAGRDGFIDLMELKLMMEKLGAPQTHLGLKNMIKEVDEDFDSKLSFREALRLWACILLSRRLPHSVMTPSGLNTWNTE